MRMAIWSAIATEWDECSNEPDVQDPDVVINVYDLDSADQIWWNICHNTLFSCYVDCLLPLSQVSVSQSIDTVDFKSLIQLNQLGGRGCTTLVYTRTDPLPQFVFKGIDFRTYLNSFESGHIDEEVEIFYRSTELVSNMPRHRNIMAPVQTLATICKPATGHMCVAACIHSSQMVALLVTSRRMVSVSEYHYRTRPDGVIRWPQPLRILTSSPIPTTWTSGLETSSSTQIIILC